MITLGQQLQPQQYTAFKQAMAAQLPDLPVQTINTAGKFMVHGVLTTEQAAAIRAIYDEQRTAAADFNMLAYQSAERRRRQTHNARQKRTALAMRFHK